jgi:hypothetical protein
MTSEREERTDRFITDCLLEDYHNEYDWKRWRSHIDKKDKKKLVKALKRVLEYYGVDVDKEMEK